RRRRHRARAHRGRRPRAGEGRLARRSGLGRRAHRHHPRHRSLPSRRLTPARGHSMNEPPKEPVKYVDSHVRLPYHYVAGDYRALQLRAFKDKKILGSKCSKTGKVFIPPIVNSPESFAPCDEFVEVSDNGVVTTFCIVCIPVIGRDIELPYVAASVALDGADISIFAAIQECKAAEDRKSTR